MANFCISTNWTCRKCKQQKRDKARASRTSTPQLTGSRGHSASADPPAAAPSESSLKRKREGNDPSANKRSPVARISISSIVSGSNVEPPAQERVQDPGIQSTVKASTRAPSRRLNSPVELEARSRCTVLSNSSKHNIGAPEPPQKKRKTHSPVPTHHKPPTSETPVNTSIETRIDSDCFIVEPVKNVNTSATTVTTTVTPENRTNAATAAALIVPKPPVGAVELNAFSESTGLSAKQIQGARHLAFVRQKDGTSLRLPRGRKTPVAPTEDTTEGRATNDRISSAPPATAPRIVPRQPSPEIPFSRPQKSPEPDIVSSISDVIEQYRKRCEAAEDKCRALEKEAEKHKSQDEKLTAMTESCLNMEKVVREGRNQRVKLHEDMRVLRAEKDQLCDIERQGAQRLKDEVASLQTKLEEKSKDARENLRLLQEESKAKQKLAHEAETTRLRLEGQLYTVTAACAKFQEDLSAARANIGNFQLAYNQEKKLKESLEKSLCEKTDSEVLKASLTSAVEIQRLQREVAERDSLLDNMNVKFGLETRQAENFQRDLAIRVNELSTERRKAISLSNKNIDLQGRLAETEGKYEEEKEKVASSLVQVESLRSLLEAKEKEFEQSKLETIELKAQLLQSGEKNKQAEEAAALMVQLSQWQEKHTKAEESISQLLEKNKRAEEKIGQLSSQIQTIEKENGLLVSDINKACSELIRGSEGSHRKKPTMEWLNQQMIRASCFMRWRCNRLEELCERGKLSLPEDGFKREKFVFFDRFLPDLGVDGNGLDAELSKLGSLGKEGINESGLERLAPGSSILRPFFEALILNNPASSTSTLNEVALDKPSLDRFTLDNASNMPPAACDSASSDSQHALAEPGADGRDVEMNLEIESEPQSDEPAFDFDSEFSVTDPFAPDLTPAQPVFFDHYKKETRTRSIRTSNDRGFKKPRWRRCLERPQQNNKKSKSISGTVVVTNADGSLCTEDDDEDELGGIKTRKRGRMSFEGFTGVELARFVPITMGVSEKLAFKKFEKVSFENRPFTI
ncbi:hypothetical protein AA313_de0202769 [Arthrobotrys entomopaga]|nr:hypothetical protein AA313_de0202769 [Arthrobotrys entomopaga]